jgi:integrase/recombinase XerD
MMKTPVSTALPARLPPQATNDEECIRLWLYGASARTISAYEGDIEQFRNHVQKPLNHVGLSDIQSYLESLVTAPATKARALAAVKSLVSFAVKIGYMSTNVAQLVRQPKVPNNLSKHFLTEDEIKRMFAAESRPRNHLILKMLYYSGARVSELCGMKFKDFQERSDGKGARVTIHGKGGKSRSVNVSEELWLAVKLIHGQGAPDEPVFASRKEGGNLTASQVFRIVRDAAVKANIGRAVSPHWYRHASATHAISHGAPLHLVQATLGHSSLSVTGLYLHANPEESSGLYLPR